MYFVHCLTASHAPAVARTRTNEDPRSTGIGAAADARSGTATVQSGLSSSVEYRSIHLTLYLALLDRCLLDPCQGAHTRGLHSSTFQLNLSALYGVGGARRGGVARANGVIGGA